jgi:hypothetical protein
MDKEMFGKRYNLFNLIKHTSRSGNKTNFVKYWKGTSYEHWRVLSDIAFKLINLGFDILPEVEFINGSRADLVAISNNKKGEMIQGYIIEVLCSETDKMYDKKLNNYPIQFYMVKVKAKDFDFKTWKL